MTNAANEDGLIIWTFDPISIGWTQVVVTTIPAPPRIGINQAIYTIEVLGREVFTIPICITDGSEAGAPDDYLSFLGRVFIATRLVKLTWPNAELWWVTTHLPAGVLSLTTDPNNLRQLRAAFNVHKGTVMIDSKGWGLWDKLVFYDFKLFGNLVVPFPIKMDIVDAYKIMVEKGYCQLEE
jgi:hypothetical protein